MYEHILEWGTDWCENVCVLFSLITMMLTNAHMTHSGTLSVANCLWVKTPTHTASTTRKKLGPWDMA